MIINGRSNQQTAASSQYLEGHEIRAPKERGLGAKRLVKVISEDKSYVHVQYLIPGTDKREYTAETRIPRSQIISLTSIIGEKEIKTLTTKDQA